MKNFALTAAAILVATTGAFAGSDHFAQRPVNQSTASTSKPDMVRHGMPAAMQSAAEEPARDNWGN